MRELKLSVYEIKKLISLREEYWEYNFYTNCYAFALGLDVPENDIVKNAYQLGVIGATIKNMPMEFLSNMSFEERLLLDLKALKITCKEVSPNEQSSSDFLKENGRYSFVELYWLIALFSNGTDFHFLRKNYEGIWYHKFGYLAPPINYDSDRQIITNPETCNVRGYRYIKTYKLKSRIKWEDF